MGRAVEIQTEVTPLQRLLLEHMEATGETFSAIAKRGGLPRQTVQAVLYSKGARVPLESTMAKLAKGLGVSVATVRAAVAKGLTEERPNGASLRSVSEDPVLLVLMETASELGPDQRRVLVETAQALRRLSATQPPRRASTSRRV